MLALPKYSLGKKNRYNMHVLVIFEVRRSHESQEPLRAKHSPARLDYLDPSPVWEIAVLR